MSLNESETMSIRFEHRDKPKVRPGAHGDMALRSHAMGADSVRRVLMTVMGEFLRPSGGLAWTAAFIELFQRLGVEPGTTRQALARTAARGWLTSERIGGRTRWRLTPTGEQLLVELNRRIYEFAGPTLDWDGRWLVVLASLPESQRDRRHLVRTRLSWAGLGSPAAGVWVGTHTSRIAEVEDVLAEAGLLDTTNVFIAQHLRTAGIGRIVEQAWDLASIETEYEEFIAEFASRRAADPLRRVFELVHAWRRFPLTDPALPRELLPRDWKGADAVELFHDRHERWAPAAADEWNRILAESDRAPKDGQ